MTSSSSLTDWLASRAPSPPHQLASRVGALVSRVDMSGADVTRAAVHAATLLAAGTEAMREVLRDGCLTRESASHLLAVDALVTYAFEAAADAPEQLEALAGEALAAIAALAEPYEA